MSTKELSRLEVMQKLTEKRMSQNEAASMLVVSVRHVKRLLSAYRRYGAQGLISKRRGRPSNNRLAEATKHKALGLLKSKYQGFGPTLAHEKLIEVDGLKISDESIRQLMIAEGLWKTRKARKVVVHQMRARRACFGELVQLDGSPHDWFEGRAPGCTLLVFIDDASGRLGELRFVESESFFSYAQASRVYFERHGKPVAFYSDKHGIFRVNAKNALSGSGVTQFGRAMKSLDIEIICAHTPQAKGRVERVNLTLQDRLVKELRLRNISTIEAANAFVSEYIEDFNHRFAIQPRSSHDAHRPLLFSADELNRILSWQETRVLSKNLTIQYRKVIYQIQTRRPSYALRKAQVTLCENPQGEITILYKGHPLQYSIFHKQQRQAQVLTRKEIDAHLNKQTKPHKPNPDHPWRTYGQRLNGKLIQESISHDNV